MSRKLKACVCVCDCECVFYWNRINIQPYKHIFDNMHNYL